jgi:hypothetical protein
MELHVGRSVDDGCFRVVVDVVQKAVKHGHCVGSRCGLLGGKSGHGV